ncbi:D-serine dehydratase [Sinorhizobium americanum]|uniref:D-serine dehydratase n=2 Tax=Sinorhizobium americanum TaxID=194963 RepID=A0A4R2B7V4_9HYPH|nr:amino acid deaminase [Sinorhizobium americanum]TCN22787.1 D-serine dehydratase [Sinorhizobium americanum]
MNRIEKLAGEIGVFELTPGFRGIPAGTGPGSSSTVREAHWHPADGEMSLPLLSLDLKAYEDNKATMIGICRDFGCEIAPHIKTPMSPVLARDLVESGAWGISVADLRQAEVMLRHGLRRLLIANEIGGKSAVVRLTRLLKAYPEADVHMFTDSVDVVRALVDRWLDDPALPPLKLLAEIGCGRGGVNTDGEAEELVRAIAGLNSDRIILAGIAAYEGTVNRPDHQDMSALMDDLFCRVSVAMKAARAAVGPEKPIILSMGGSSLFDYVIDRCSHMLKADGNAMLLLRSGACFFSDNGPIRARLQAIAERGLLGPDASRRIANSFAPVLRIWAEVLSVNGAHDAICGFGLRDVAHDQGLPVAMVLWRDGARLAILGAGAVVSKLNDQHAFVRAPEFDLAVGDVIEFGIKHPCTTIDKHDLIFGLDEQGDVSVALRTFFG